MPSLPFAEQPATASSLSAPRGLRVALCCTHVEAQPWEQALRVALPHATVQAWPRSVADADYAVVWNPPQAFLNTLVSPKAIFNVGAGVDALMRMRLPPSAQIVRVEDGGMAVQMADYVCHAVLGHFRDFGGYADDARAGRWEPRKPRLRSDFPLGVMGLGALGERVARSLAQFEFPVLGWSRNEKSIPGVRCLAGPSQLDEFLSSTRILVCMLPLTPETQNLMCRQSLLRLKPGGYIINVARGAHLVEDDLIELIDSGHLAGATLDVFRTEPLSLHHPFWKHPKVTLTPHISAQTLIGEALAQIAAKITLMEQGRTVTGLVDTSRGY